jgi:thiamine-monophosphate kinase
MNIPSWMLYAGQHGEFELLFTIPSEKEAAFITEAKKTGWNPLRIGVAAREQEIRVKLYNKSRVIDTRKLRDLPFITGGNIKTYLDKLLQYDQTLKVQERIAEM